MRLIVMFDLPTETPTDIKRYTEFRKFLIKNGYIMMQYSIYTKLVLNNNSALNQRQKLKDNTPPNGLVQLLIITEKQFSSIDNIVGKSISNVINTDDRVIIL